jgi:hypothetical protein
MTPQRIQRDPLDDARRVVLHAMHFGLTALVRPLGPGRWVVEYGDQAFPTPFTRHADAIERARLWVATLSTKLVEADYARRGTLEPPAR